MNEMLIGLVIVQFVVMAYTAGWFIGNKPVKELRANNEEVHAILNVQSDKILELQEENHGLDKAIDELKKRNNELNFENESLRNKHEPKVNSANPLDNVLSALIAETNKEDEVENKRLKEIKSAWNYQPVALSKRMKGDS